MAPFLFFRVSNIFPSRELIYQEQRRWAGTPPRIMLEVMPTREKYAGELIRVRLGLDQRETLKKLEENMNRTRSG